MFCVFMHIDTELYYEYNPTFLPMGKNYLLFCLKYFKGKNMAEQKNITPVFPPSPLLSKVMRP